MDNEKCKHDMKDAFELSARVYDHVHELADAGEPLGSNRLVVVETRLYTPRWAWQSRQAPKVEPLVWNECESALMVVLESM